jgi:hypothetical protein
VHRRRDRYIIVGVTKQIFLKKEDGEMEEFIPEKLRVSLQKAGATKSIADSIIDITVKELEAGATETHNVTEVYKHAFTHLKRLSIAAAARYSLRRSIMEFGPTGFPFEDYIAEIFRYTIREQGDKIFNLFSVTGTAEFNGRNCTVLQYENPEFGFENYTVKENETLTGIAHANHVSDYMLLTVNKLKGYTGVKTGQVIKVPVSYGKKIVLYLDEYNHLPLMQIVYDENGLYEKYEFKSFVLNPKFSDNDFSPDNDKYGF